MDQAVERHPRRAGRLLLLAAGAGLLWAGISLVMPSGAAQAAEDDAPRGLVGVVTHVTGAAGGLVGAVTDTVGQVAPPLAPVTDAVSHTVSGLTGTVDHVVEAVPDVVPPVTPIVEPVVTHVLQPVVDHVVQPVVDTVATVTEPVPVVGGLVGAVDLSGTVAAVPALTESLDTAVDTTLTGPPSVSDPRSPDTDAVTDVPVPSTGTAQTGEDAAIVASAESAAPAAAEVVIAGRESRTHAGFHPLMPPSPVVLPDAADPAPADEPRNGDPWPVDAAPAPSSGAGSAGASGQASLWAADHTPSALAAWSSARSASDRLPSCPVFGTDASPD